MMKIKLFDIREDDKNFAYRWRKVNNHEIVCVEEYLTLDNVSALEAVDAISTQQLHKYDDDIYEELNKVGIKKIAGRTAGFDMFNKEEAAKHDIKITNIP